MTCFPPPRWHPDIVEFTTILYCHGGESMLHLLSGNMFEGSGKWGSKPIDMSRTNLMLPSVATIKRNIPAWNTGEGVHRVAVLQYLYMLRAKVGCSPPRTLHKVRCAVK